MDYTLNRWPTLVGYCERSDLRISNMLAENAIRPFALGQEAWLFADTSQGASSSAMCYYLVETAKPTAWNPRLIPSICWHTLLRLTRWRNWKHCRHGT